MRIAYITETFPPETNRVALGAERAVRHLRDAGHAVQLIRPARPGEQPMDSAGEWRTAGGPVPMRPGLRFGWASGADLRVRWQRERPDLVHAATPGPLAWSALKTARGMGIPTSADFNAGLHAHDHHAQGWARPFMPLMLACLRRLHAHADCTFVPSPQVASLLAGRGFGHMRVAGHGVDAHRFSPALRDGLLRQAWGAGDGDPVMLHVGQLARGRNVEVALRTFERLRRHEPRLRMVAVGDGPLRPDLQERHPGVRFVGVKTGDELARCYASADVLLSPCLAGTFGDVTLEALASGLAVAAFDTAAAAMHVQDGHSGCLAAAGSAKDFSRAAERALVHARPGSPMRQHARAAGLLANWDATLKRFDQALRAVAAHRVPDTARRAALA